MSRLLKHCTRALHISHVSYAHLSINAHIQSHTYTNTHAYDVSDDLKLLLLVMCTSPSHSRDHSMCAFDGCVLSVHVCACMCVNVHVLCMCASVFMCVCVCGVCVCVVCVCVCVGVCVCVVVIILQFYWVYCFPCNTPPVVQGVATVNRKHLLELCSFQGIES